MSKLSCEAQALVHAARGVLRPSDADRERVLYALQASLGERVAEAAAAAVVPRGKHERCVSDS